jgi:hypothetical protein
LEVQMKTKFTRRQLATVLASATATAAAQQPQSPPTDLLQAARDRMKNNAAALSKPEIPMATEPAFAFKA